MKELRRYPHFKLITLRLPFNKTTNPPSSSLSSSSYQTPNPFLAEWPTSSATFVIVSVAREIRSRNYRTHNALATAVRVTHLTDFRSGSNRNAFSLSRAPFQKRRWDLRVRAGNGMLVKRKNGAFGPGTMVDDVSDTLTQWVPQKKKETPDLPKPRCG